MTWVRIERLLFIFSRCVGLCGLSILLLLAVFIIIDIVIRWLLNTPYEGVGDISRVLLPIIISSCFPIGLLQHRHVTIRFLGKSLGPHWEAWFNLFGGICLVLFFSLIAWQFTLYTIELQAVGEHTWVIQIPMTPWWWVTTCIMASCVPLQALRVVFDFIRDVTGRGAPQSYKEGMQF